MRQKSLTDLLSPSAASLLLVIVLSGCVANTPRQMTPLPSAPMLGLTGEPAFDTADRWSFTQAVFNYSTGRKDAFHQVPVGDYLLSGLVGEARSAGVTGLKLTQFESSGRMGFGIVGRNIVTLRIQIAYTQGGATRSFTHEITERDIGPLYMGEYSVVPFTSAGQTNDEIFHKQVRPLIDDIVIAFKAQLAQTPAHL